MTAPLWEASGDRETTYPAAGTAPSAAAVALSAAACSRRALALTSAAMMLSPALSGLLGMVYWVLAARWYDAAAVGVASAAVSAMVLLSTVAQLNLTGALARYVPRAGSHTRMIVLGSWAVTGALGAVPSVAVIVLLRGVDGGAGDLVRHLPPAWFCVGVATWCVFALQDTVLAALDGARWVPVGNAVFGVVKLVLLAVAARLACLRGSSRRGSARWS